MQLESYLNEMTYLEEDEEKKEWSDTLELRDTQQVMKVDDDMLLVIFDAPTESPVLETFERHRSHPTRRQAVYTVDK